ncbi:MAG TPA: asparagine synthase-related protein, partial [Polyangiaceae bacterium]|nr:asparagine synthase-related protein [Polyangiaceae bacterium]
MPAQRMPSSRRRNVLEAGTKSFVNLLAVRELDPRLRRDLFCILEESGAFELVRDLDGWVIATAPLDADCPSHDAEAEDTRVFFAEGRELFAEWSQLARMAERAAKSPAQLDAFEGDFGFIALAPSGLIAARACGGCVPFYYLVSRTRYAVGTRLGFFPRFVDGSLNLDPLVAATWATAIDFFPDGRSLLAGVKVLERGHVLSIDPHGTLRVQRYWDPRPRHLPRPSPERRREHADALRHELLTALRANLDPRGRNLLTLSGGVDSSSLAALSGKLGIPISTLTFMPEASAVFERERVHVERAHRAAKLLQARIVRLAPRTWFELQRQAPESVVMVLHPALCMLPDIARELDIRVLFGGEFADVVCGSTPTLKDWAAETSLFRLLTGLHALPNGRSDIPDWFRYKLRLWLGRPYTRYPAELPAIIRPSVRAEYAAWARARSREVARDPLPRPALPLYAEHVGFVAQNWEVCSELGIRRFYPFFSRRALELAYACHPVE